MNKENRGVVYVYWGDRAKEEVNKSIASIVPLPYHIIELDKTSNLNDKSKMYDLSPFDETVFLDTDTVVLDDITYGFEMANKFGIAITIAPACYAGRHDKSFTKDLVEYNNGVVFFKKDHKVKEVFEKWKELAFNYPISQTGLARAFELCNFNPFVLPQNYNYRADFLSPVFGPIKIWHSRLPIPKNIEDWNNKDEYTFGNYLRYKQEAFFLTDKESKKSQMVYKRLMAKIFNNL